jgi:glycosyltransferase involved in cell wall biosynthesis
MSALVSIIIPVYNRANIIGDTLESVLNQSYKNWECIIVDDGSNDKTVELVESYCFNDSRFKLFIRPEEFKKGGNVCRNLGFKSSKGDYIQWLDSDDLLEQNKLEAQIVALEKEPKASIAICEFGYFSDKKDLSVRLNIATYKDYKSGLQLLKAFGNYSEYFPPHVYLTKRTIIEKAGLWDENIIINQDGEFFTRVLLQPGKIKFVSTSVYYRGVRNDNVSLVNSSEKVQKLIACWELVERHLIRATGKQRHVYLETAKKNIYNNIKGRFPSIIEGNAAFFNLRISLFKRIFNIK